MRILVDTQCFLWSFLDPSRLSDTAKRVLSDGEDELFFSAASSWEIAIKAGIGKLRLPEPPEDYVPPRIVRAGMTALDVTHAHALRVHALPPVHRDPFDRLLVAQSVAEGLTILTADPQIGRYSIPTLW
ncbi:MAG: type II toxin-antitoxin system VapC family toxin [Pyrinomonadaceae bacterium]